MIRRNNNMMRGAKPQKSDITSGHRGIPSTMNLKLTLREISPRTVEMRTLVHHLWALSVLMNTAGKDGEIFKLEVIRVSAGDCRLMPLLITISPHDR